MFRAESLNMNNSPSSFIPYLYRKYREKYFTTRDTLETSASVDRARLRSWISFLERFTLNPFSIYLCRLNSVRVCVINDKISD